MSLLAEMGSAASKICAAVFYRPVLINSEVVFCRPQARRAGGTAMDDREELRRLIDVIEKGSGSGSLEQAVDDIKTFANTASFLANKLDTRLKGGEVKAKKQPKSRMGKAISTVPTANNSTKFADRAVFYKYIRHANGDEYCNVTG